MVQGWLESNSHAIFPCGNINRSDLPCIRTVSLWSIIACHYCLYSLFSIIWMGNQTYLVELIYLSIFLPSSLVTKVDGMTKVKAMSVGSSSDMIVPIPPRSLMLKSWPLFPMQYTIFPFTSSGIKLAQSQALPSRWVYKFNGTERVKLLVQW